jgi:hypothetical protein
MIVRLIAITLITASFFTVASPVTVTVTEIIDGKSDSVVRQNARIKAQYAGIERLPVVMTGYEQLTDNNFATKIKAYLVGDVNVLTMNEIWDRNNDTYTLSAQVSLNRQASLEMIDGIRNNLELQNKLEMLYDELDRITSEQGFSNSDYTNLSERILDVQSGFLIRDSIASSTMAKEDFIADSYRYFNRRYMTPLIEKTNVIITSVDKSLVHFNASVDIGFEVSNEMKKYWNSTPERKAAFFNKKVDICFAGGNRMNISSRYRKSYNKTFKVYHYNNEDFISNPNKILTPMLCYY